MIAQILCFLRELDWSTPLRRVRWRDQWRVHVVTMGCTLPAFAMWWILFPHTIWFFQLFGAVATGGITGVVIGFIWQLAVPIRRTRTSGRYLVNAVFCGWGVFLPVALFVVGPMLHSEETELAKIQSLKDRDIAAICVDTEGGLQTKTADRASVISFVEKCCRGDLFYVSHESFSDKARLTIHFVGGTKWTYDAGVPERHPRDLVITFSPHLLQSYILIPDAAEWLESLCGSELGQDKGS